jgi:hypothetical protein
MATPRSEELNEPNTFLDLTEILGSENGDSRESIIERNR